jgi:sulfhydrogenase subunit beta (sulfur reductase)
MDSMKLSKDKLNSFVAILAEQKQLYMPQAEGEALKFAPANAKAQPDLVFSNTAVPAKSVVFPQVETLFRYEVEKTDIKMPAGEEERVLLGVRPCDARAMSIVDSLFSWDVDDPYYLGKREKTTVVGLACQKPGVNCFCSSVGGGPASTEGLDVLLTDLGESFLVAPLTEKGEKLCQAAGEVLEQSSSDDLNSAEKLHQEAAALISRSIDTAGIPEKLPGLMENGLWKEVSEACLGCGICTFLCPTCHCFDIQDEIEGFEGRRCRMWDSCMFGEYTMHTSGHNPRPTRRERTRNRINHKYNYFVEKFDVIACVGCGRCITSCPVNIDIIEILQQVKEAQ